MNKLGENRESHSGSLFIGIILFGCVVALLFAFFRLGGENPSTATLGTSRDAAQAARRGATPAQPGMRSRGTTPARPAEEVVADKLVRFARSRAEIARTLAARLNVTVPPDVEKFFSLVEAGLWDEANSLYNSMNSAGMSGGMPPEGAPVWQAVTETYGVGTIVSKWPAQALLDYGNAILDTLSPGTVYFGGTDAGRYIPALLADTSGGHAPIVLTQNALADSSYLTYLNFVFEGRFNSLTPDDSQRAFQDYLTDAQRRLQHDTDFPDQPRQLRPGEEVRMTDNRVQVSGQVAVMSINEKLVAALMEKNPDARFAIEQGFPLSSTYSEAGLLGPVLELRASSAGGSDLPSEQVWAAVDYWRTRAEQLTADSTTADQPDVRNAYAKLAVEQAALLEARQQLPAASETMAAAYKLAPVSPEITFRFVNHLLKQSRNDEALAVVQNSARLAPENRQFQDLLSQIKKTIR